MLQIESSETSRKKMEKVLEGIKERANQVKQEHQGEMTLVGEKLEDLEVDDNSAAVFNALRGLHSDILGICDFFQIRLIINYYYYYAR